MLYHDSIVHHLLEVLEGVHQQLILNRTIETIPEVVLLLLIICYFCWGITKNGSKLPKVSSKIKTFPSHILSLHEDNR